MGFNSGFKGLNSFIPSLDALFYSALHLLHCF